MVNGKLLVDDLVDPIGWLSAMINANPQNGLCIDAKLNEVQYIDGNLSLRLSWQDQNLIAELRGNQLKTLTLSQAAEILMSYRGNFLLSALAHRIDVGR